jgi:hypothetical protein
MPAQRVSGADRLELVVAYKSHLGAALARDAQQVCTPGGSELTHLIDEG